MHKYPLLNQSSLEMISILLNLNSSVKSLYESNSEEEIKEAVVSISEQFSLLDTMHEQVNAIVYDIISEMCEEKD